MIFVPYFLFFIFIYCSNFIIINRNSIRKSVFSYYWFLLFIFVSIAFIGLRGFVFTDWVSYYKQYEEIPINFKSFIYAYKNNLISKDFGFSLLEFICKQVSPNYFFFQFISFIIDFCILYFAYNELKTEHIILNFLFFFLYSGMHIEINLLRNSKAMALFILSLKYIKQDKSFIKYELINVLGFLFHTSALIYLPLYFFLGKDLKQRTHYFIMILFFLLMITHISFTNTIILKVLSFLPQGRTLGKLIRYLTSEKYSSALGISFISIERFVSYFVFIYFYPRMKKNDENISVYLNVYVLYYIICFLFWDFYIISHRGGFLFIMAYSLLYPAVYSVLKTKNTKYLFLFIFLLYGSLKVYKDMNQPSLHYTTFINEMSYSRKVQKLNALIN